MEPFIKINGHPYPSPDDGVTLHIATLVDSARNSDAVVVAQRIGRDQQKVENLSWTYLPAETWASILREFDEKYSGNFYAMVTYPDMVANDWTTRKMYPGDRTAKPFGADPTTGLPVAYRECKVNIIDVGEPEVV